MKTELIVRAGYNDHEAVSDLLTPGPRSLDSAPPPIDRLLVDATTASRRPEFADTAQRAGMPLLVDPLTHLSQVQLQPDDKWRDLPYAKAPNGEAALERLVDEVVTFQLEQKATMVIPPYFFSSRPGDEWWHRSAAGLRLTARLLDREHIDLPIAPVVCVQLQHLFADDAAEDLASYGEILKELQPEFIALCVSPVGSGDEGVSKMTSLFRAHEYFQHYGDVVAWRQGVYGPALVAAGARAYETGIATGEQCNIRGSLRSRTQPKPEKRSGGPSYGILVETWGRSVSTKIADVLVADDAVRARTTCMDETCCPDGHSSTVSNRRGHAVRTRARYLRNMRQQPRRWRLYDVERTAEEALTLAQDANKLLERADLRERIKTKGFTSLAEVARGLRERDTGSAVA